MQRCARMHQAESRDATNTDNSSSCTERANKPNSSLEGQELRIPPTDTRSHSAEEEPTRHRKMFVIMEQHLSLQRVDESCYYAKAGRKQVPAQVSTHSFLSSPCTKAKPLSQTSVKVTSGHGALTPSAAKAVAAPGEQNPGTPALPPLSSSGSLPGQPPNSTEELSWTDGESQAEKDGRDPPPY